MKNPLYSGDPKEWDSLDLAEQLEFIRKDLCTGPCAASGSTMLFRSRINRALAEAKKLAVRAIHEERDRDDP